MTLGNKIQKIKCARGMSQEQFGKMLNTTRQTVSKWELDQVVPDIREIVAISKLFCASTEKIALHYYCNEDKSVIEAKVYEGNGDVKKLVSDSV